MSAHAGLATDAGLGAARVTNGDVLELDISEPSVIRRVHTGRLGLSGSSLVPLSDRSLSERRALADGGLMTLTIVLDEKTRLVTEPLVQFIGVPSGDIDPESLSRDLSHATEEILLEMSSRTLQSDDSLRAALQRELGALVRQWLGVKPKQLVNLVRI